MLIPGGGEKAPPKGIDTTFSDSGELKNNGDTMKIDFGCGERADIFSYGFQEEIDKAEEDRMVGLKSTQVLGKSKNGFIQELRQLIDPLDVYELKQLIELLLETVQESNKILTKDNRAWLVKTMIDKVRFHRALYPSDMALRMDSKCINQIVNLLEIMIVKDNPDFWKDHPEFIFQYPTAVSVSNDVFFLTSKEETTTVVINESKSKKIYSELRGAEVLNSNGSINKKGLAKLFDEKVQLSEKNRMHLPHVVGVLKNAIQQALRQSLFMKVQPYLGVPTPFSLDQARPKAKEKRQKAHPQVFLKSEIGIDAAKSSEIYGHFEQLKIINRDHTVNKHWLKKPTRKETDPLTDEQFQHCLNVLKRLGEPSVPGPSSSGAGGGGR